MATTRTDATTVGKRTAIPLTIVTGFLGSGKTTLINHLLSELVKRQERVAIIQNEFADSADVEQSMVSDSSGGVFTNVVELANGCVCCSVRDNFAVAVEQLAKSNMYTYLILECSGMAEPGPVIGMFWIDDDLEADIYLDGVISVCDCKYLLGHAADVEAAEAAARESGHADGHVELSPKLKQIIHQIAYADRLLLNKVDLIKDDKYPQRLLALTKFIVRHNSIGQVIMCEKGKVELEQVLSIRAYDMSTPPNLDALTKRLQHDKEEKTKFGGGVHTHGDGEKCTEHGTDSLDCGCSLHGVGSVVIERSGVSVDLDAMEEWLGELLWQDAYVDSDLMLGGEEKIDSSEPVGDHPKRKNSHKMKIYRMKGLFGLTTGEKSHLQAVQELFAVEKSGSDWTGTEPMFKLVVIGENLNRAFIESGLESVLTLVSESDIDD